MFSLRHVFSLFLTYPRRKNFPVGRREKKFRQEGKTFHILHPKTVYFIMDNWISGNLHYLHIFKKKSKL